MLRNKLSILTFTSLFVVFVSTVNAASLTLTHIGALATGGQSYPNWWYTGVDPILRGTADSGEEVTVTVDSVSGTATADSSGNWNFASSMDMGDHNVTISAGSESYSFALSITSTPPTSFTSGTAESTQSTTAVPMTGSNHLVAFIGAMSLIALGVYHYDRSSSSKKNYEKKVLKNI